MGDAWVIQACPRVTQTQSQSQTQSAEGRKLLKLRGAMTAALPTVIVSERCNREPNDLRPELQIWLTASCQLLAAKFSKSVVLAPHPWGLLHPTAILRYTHARTCTPSQVMSFATHCLNPGHVRVAEIHVHRSMSAKGSEQVTL